MSVTSWFLVSSSGTRHRLPQEMIFVGREDCELMLQSRSVDKQHAVVNYNHITDEHMVKDLGSLNGTFVNDLRIPEQIYITLKLSDVIRFGYDAHVYILERSQHKVPEEALKHEKYTIQLQMSMKALEARKRERQQSEKKISDSPRSSLEKAAERKTPSEAPVSRPTPLYGQPSWWGEDDGDGEPREHGTDGQRPDEEPSEDPKEANGSLSDGQGKSIHSYRREPSYFEIPTKEFQQQKPKKPNAEVYEVPTKDTNPPSVTSSAPTPPVAQSHASFTIEFDECAPGKMKIKDHVTKFSLRQRKLPGKDSVTAPTEVMSAESKVADWLVQSDVNMMRRSSRTEDMFNAKGDGPAHHMTTKTGLHLEDGTQKEPVVSVEKVIQSRPPVAPWSSSLPPLRASSPKLSPPRPFTPPDSEERLSCSPSGSLSPPPPPPQGQETSDLQQAFVIEFFDDNPRKKRSQSFTNNTNQPDTSNPKTKPEKRKGYGQAEEKLVSSPGQASPSHPATQQYTVPLKTSGSSGPQRAGSLRREKTEDRISTGFSSRSATSARPFGSVGRRSKLAQDFNAEFLMQVKQRYASPSWKKKTEAVSPPDSPEETVVPPQPSQSPPSPPEPCPVPYLAQTSSPIHQPAPLNAPLMAKTSGSMEVRSPRGPRNEEDDSLSDAGTYTIDSEVQDKEVEEARSKINKVFGVVENPEQPSLTADSAASEACRPGVTARDRQEHSQGSTGELRPAPALGDSLEQVQPGGALGPKWVSRWASLADSYSDSGPVSGLFDLPAQMDLSAEGRRIIHQAMLGNRTLDISDSEGLSSRTRRVLPQVPPGEKSETPTPSIHIRQESYSAYEETERSSAVPRQQETPHRLSVQDDVEPDSLSDASKSDDGSVKERRRRPISEKPEKGYSKEEEKPLRLPAKSTSFYIGSEESLSKQERGSCPTTPKPERKISTPPKTYSTATLTKQKGSPDSVTVKPNASAPNLDYQDRESPQSKESSSPGSLVRQESFTKDRPSDVSKITKLPNISSQPALRIPDPAGAYQSVGPQDTHSYLKDTQDVLASLEAKIQAQQSDVTACPGEDSLSGESDMDTSSTVSQRSGKTAPNATAKRSAVTTSGLQREKSTASSISQDSNRQPSARDRLSEKRRTQGLGVTAKTDPSRRLALRRSIGKHGSTDLSDDPQSSSLPHWPDTISSDQESGSRAAARRKPSALQQREEGGKTSRSAVAQALSRSNSLSAPRATRASMLRRARLGEASDNEGTETDRISLNSQEAGAAPSKTPQEGKKLSRLDLLAMPRKRTSSFTTPSDTESSVVPGTSGRNTGFSNRSTESNSSSTRVRKASIPTTKPALQRSSGGPSKPVTRGRSTSAKYAGSTASSRRRHKGSDYTSTSEEEYDSNQSTPKHKRSSHPPSASQSPHTQPRPQPLVPLHPRARARGPEEETHEGDAFQNWSSHSAEIAKLSQDLAKDLAILAREIHDVAGEADPPSSPGPETTMTAHDELGHHLPEAGPSVQRDPPGSGSAAATLPEPNNQEQNSSHPGWNPQEVMVDNLMLDPVSQISLAIRENTEQLTEKIKALFQNKTEVWEEIEAKIHAENDIPVLKNANKEITSILKELRRVQRQLEVINTIMEPSGHLDPARTFTPTYPSSADGAPSRAPSRDWRASARLQGGSHRGGGPRPSEGLRRAAVTSEGESYVV